MARILITGATGFIGKRLSSLLAGDHEIYAIARNDMEDRSGIRWLKQDLAADRWDIALPDRIDAVVHLAQSAHFREFPEQAADIYNIAAGTTMHLLDYARRAGARHFILASTGGVYGYSDKPVRETDVLTEMRSQLGFYFAAKRSSELIAMQYASEMSVIILRCFFVYGSGQASQMLMPRLVASVQRGQPVQLQGEQGIQLNPIHVSDAVQAIARCLQLTESRILNLAGPEVVTIKDIAQTIGRFVRRDPVFSVDTTTRPNHLVADISRLVSACGRPETMIDAGLAELIAGGQ